MIGKEEEEERSRGMGLCFSESNFIAAPHANTNTGQHCSNHSPETQPVHAAWTAGIFQHRIKDQEVCRNLSDLDINPERS